MSHAADQQLIEAVQAGDEVAVAQALAGGADPNAAVSRYQGSVLIEAARSGMLGVVGLLVDAGARIGPFGTFHVTPLRVAMLEAHADVVQYLIAHGALPAESTTRTSVLTEAVSYTRHRPRPAALATLRVLLDAGATPHPGEEAPLITAVPAAVAVWERAWDRFIPFLAFPPELRKIIHATSAIESFNYQIRKVIKNRGHFPTDDAVVKLIWLAIADIEDKRARQRATEAGKPRDQARQAPPRLVEGTGVHGWKQALNALELFFPGRIPVDIR